MRICINGIYYDQIPDEITEAEAHVLELERQYWSTVSYDEAVNAEIRKKYSESQEFAILRQKDEKPEEYAVYYAYCENCKAYAKEKKTMYANEGAV